MMNSGTINAESRHAGICVVFASLLFLISAAVHGVIHPEVEASAADSMPRIAQQATLWQAAHLFFALSAALFSAAALTVLCARTRLISSSLGVTGWLLLVAFALTRIVKII